MIRGLTHELLHCSAGTIRFQQRASRDVMFAIDGARFAAMQVASVTDKGDQENHWSRFNSTAVSGRFLRQDFPKKSSAPLRSRLRNCHHPLPYGRGSDTARLRSLTVAAQKGGPLPLALGGAQKTERP